METLLHYLAVIFKWRRLIVSLTFISTIVALIISLLLPVRYTATAQILPPTEETDLLSFASPLYNIQARTLSRTRLLFSQSTPSDLIGAMFKSRTVMEGVIRECDLMKVFKLKKPSMEKATRFLKKMTDVSVSDEGIIRVSVEARTPQLAAAITNQYIKEVDRFLRESVMSRGKNMRFFIEGRLAEAERELKVAQESLLVFQKRHNVGVLDEETKSVVEAYAKLKSQLIVKEATLGVIRNFSEGGNPLLENTQRDVTELKKKLQEMETGYSGGYGLGFAVPFKRLPELMAEYTRRYLECKIKQEVYALLSQQYEQAKITEARDTPAITVLDYARLPEKKSYPKRALIVLGSFIISLTVSIVIAFIQEYLQTKADDNIKGKLINLREAIVSDWHRIFKRK